MKRTEKRASLIEKERNPMLRFSPEDVLQDPTARSICYYSANRTTISGNAYHNKATITFCTEDGDVKKVETTVCCYVDKFVLLKSGMFLPYNPYLSLRTSNGAKSYSPDLLLYL